MENPSVSGRKILVIEDEPDVAEGLAALLISRGYYAGTAYNGKDAIDRAKREKPDLILIDVGLPLIDGFESCRQIKQDPTTRHIPVLILTAGDKTQENLDQSFNARANAYITKPYDNDELLAKIEKFLSGTGSGGSAPLPAEPDKTPTGPRPWMTFPEKGIPSSCRVLIVDDSSFARAAVREILEGHGHQVVGEAHDSEQALRLYRENKPDLVTMDINMSPKGGIEAMREIRTMDSKARFIVVTAIDQKAVLEEFERLGGCEYVFKPAEWEKFQFALERVFAGRPERPTS